MKPTRENWSSRIGIIMAVSGSAIGLGNFLRFPTQVVENGGGAFMIPYFTAFLLLGIPLSFAEWTLGRYGGQYGYGSTPGVFHLISGKQWAKYLGIFGLFVPLVISFYYLLIESWCLAYAFFSIMGMYRSISNTADLKDFLQEFQNLVPPEQLPNFPWQLVFFFITFFVNYWIVSRGISAGIEKLSRFGMPILFLLALVLLVRVFTLPAHPNAPDQTVMNGLGFLWNPDFSKLSDVNVWLAAAGQIFFTLSVGMGAILAYSSYLKKEDDVAHSALSAASTNEFAEVILGASIMIPATFVFLGAIGAAEVVKSGSFNLGFVIMPMIFNQLPLGNFIGFTWFALLFLAGITSSVSLIQPILTFLQDEIGLNRKKAILIVGSITLVVSFTLKRTLALGTLDQFDFWGGTFLPVVSGFIMVIMFGWVFGAKEGWEELNRASKIQVPKLFVLIIQYITPLYLGIMLFLWIKKNIPTIVMDDIVDLQVWKATLIARGGLIVLGIILVILIYIAGKNYTPKTKQHKG
ncbi:MAG: sodium-dependent transporter [bacterium]|nr:sodium-dependent transporter [bacterium]